jgi:hypothetical protein
MRDPWFPIVALLIVLLGVWLGIFGPLPNGVATWIHQWQTLIAATVASLVASIAALIAFQNTSRSLTHAQALENNRRKRKHAAVRAVLPLALAQANTYAEQSARTLNNLMSACVEELLPSGVAPKKLQQQLPSETLEMFAEFIEYSDDVDVSLLETLVAHIQIHDSRLHGLVQDNNDSEEANCIVQNEIEGLILDAASLYAGVAALFDYARRR